MEFGFVEQSLSNELGGINDLHHLDRINYSKIFIEVLFRASLFFFGWDGSSNMVINCVVG